MSNCCHVEEDKRDRLLWSTSLLLAISYALALGPADFLVLPKFILVFTTAIYEICNSMYLGVLVGMIGVGILSKVPKEFVLSIMGTKGFFGILRASFAGVLLDMCNHGVLLIAGKLYERGTSTGQVIAFLVASPWNSISVTVILFTLIGVGWTILFLLLSILIAILTGLTFDYLVAKNRLPKNSNEMTMPENFQFWPEAKKGLTQTRFDMKMFYSIFKSGLTDSKMILRWIFLGIVLAGIIRATMDAEHFSSLLGPTISGLALTLLAATIIEVCSEGSLPIAGDLFMRAAAPGNSFAFLMAGVSTDYTEILILKQLSNSWRFAFFLPAVTLPQITLLAVLLNKFG
ncbi:MAG: permease [Gammaproteobacteria bacterium]|jgi:uncharacterized membrane protein YraQ (UPF0718 family)